MRTISVKTAHGNPRKVEATHWTLIGRGFGYGGVTMSLTPREALDLARRLEMWVALKGPLDA